MPNRIPSFLLFSALSILFFMLQSSGCGTDFKELEYLGIDRSTVKSLSLSRAAIQINLKYHNPNRFGIDVKETNLSIYLNDRFVAVAEQPTKTQIPRESDFIFPVVAYFEPLKVIGPALGSVFNKKNKLGIQGSAKVGKGGVYIRVPVQVSEQVSFFSE